MRIGAVRYQVITRRDFLAGSIAASAGLVGAQVDAVAQAAPLVVPPPPDPPTLLRDQSGTEADSIRIGWQSSTADCTTQVEVTGSFGQSVETRVIENATSGLIVADLPSRSLYTVRVKTVCLDNESGWSEPMALCTRIPAPRGLSGEMLPAGGAASVVWNLTFGRVVLNTDSLRVRIMRRRGAQVSQFHETSADGILSGRLHDASYGPGDSYFAQVIGADLTDPANLMISPPGPDARPLLTVSSVARRTQLESIPTFTPFGFTAGRLGSF